MNDPSITIVGGKITKIVSSQSETIQAKQFEPNHYFTSLEYSLTEGLDINDNTTLGKVVNIATLLNSLCAINNRKCAWRDGLGPRIGSSAAAYFANNKDALANDRSFTPTNIVEPKDLPRFTMDLKTKIVGVASVPMPEPVPDATPTAPVEQAAPSTKKTTRRINRTPATPAGSEGPQEVVS